MCVLWFFLSFFSGLFFFVQCTISLGHPGPFICGKKKRDYGSVSTRGTIILS